MTNFRLSQTKKFADDNFKFGENSGKLSNGVENTAGKREIACYEQFLFLPTMFSRRLVLQTCKSQGLFGKGLKAFAFRINEQEHAQISLKSSFHYGFFLK